MSVNLYHSPLDNGAMAADPFNVTAGMTLNLWAIPSVDVYALNPLNIVATGTLGLGACTAAANALCGGLIPGGRIVAWGDAINGSLAGVPLKLASIVITHSVGAGTVNLTGGAGTDFSFTDITVDPNTILFSVIPEPGTLLLLGIGLSGLVLQGRRREN